MKLFSTQLRAIKATTGDLKTFYGPSILADSLEAAQEYCNKNLGYLVVTGEVNSKRAKKNGVIRANVNYDNVNYN